MEECDNLGRKPDDAHASENPSCFADAQHPEIWLLKQLALLQYRETQRALAKKAVKGLVTVLTL